METDRAVFEIKKNQRRIEEICISCRSLEVITQHPLFEGGLCNPCKDNFLEAIFLYDEDGYQSFCTICCGGSKLLMCGSTGCRRCYCYKCLDTLVKPGTAAKTEAIEPWKCFMCCPIRSFGLIRKKRRWQLELKQFFDRESEHVQIYAPIPTDKQNPIRVLSIFRNVTEDLQDIGILDSVNDSSQKKLTFVTNVENIKRQNIKEWGPFDFVIGVCPQNSSVKLFAGKIFFQYFRLFQYARPSEIEDRPFFWIFVDPETLTDQDVKDASRFLECDPVTIYDFRKSELRLWSNIPSLKSKFAPDVYKPAWKNKGNEDKKSTQETCMEMVKPFLVPLKDYFRSYI